MATLVSDADFDVYLGGAVAADATIRSSILARVLARFQRECGRTSIPFQDAEATRVEVRDGTGSCELYLDYSITTLTSITLGFDHTNPTETLTIADLLYAAGTRRIVRTDGRFGSFGAPRYIKVTYAAAADLPVDAADAIYQEAAREYRERGSEEVQSETMGPYSVTYKKARVAGELTDWDRAVANHARVL